MNTEIRMLYQNLIIYTHIHIYISHKILIITVFLWLVSKSYDNLEIYGSDR